MTPLHHAYLLKGWLLDKNPPEEVTAAVAAIIKALGQEAVTVRGAVVQLPPLPVPSEPSDSPEQSATDKADAAELDSVEGEPEPTLVATENEQPKQRKKRTVSPEQHAAMVERMAKARAARHKKPAEEPEEKPPAFSEPELRITVPAPKRKSSLTDSDWAEIKQMLAQGRSRAAIASDYDEEPENLDFFIASCQRREAKSPGEALAPSSSVASGAARRTW